MAVMMERMRREGAAALASLDDAEASFMQPPQSIAPLDRNRAEAHVDSMHAASVARLSTIPDDPFVPTPEQGETLERIEQIKRLLALRGPGRKRRALEKRIAALQATLPATTQAGNRQEIVLAPTPPVDDDAEITRIAGNRRGFRPAPTPPITGEPINTVLLDPAQAGAPGGTVRVRGAVDGRPLNVRPSVRDFVDTLRHAHT
jgi:hypothetical protein